MIYRAALFLTSASPSQMRMETFNLFDSLIQSKSVDTSWFHRLLPDEDEDAVSSRFAVLMAGGSSAEGNRMFVQRVIVRHSIGFQTQDQGLPVSSEIHITCSSSSRADDRWRFRWCGTWFGVGLRQTLVFRLFRESSRGRPRLKRTGWTPVSAADVKASVSAAPSVH